MSPERGVGYPRPVDRPPGDALLNIRRRALHDLDAPPIPGAAARLENTEDRHVRVAPAIRELGGQRAAGREQRCQHRIAARGGTRPAGRRIPLPGDQHPPPSGRGGGWPHALQVKSKDRLHLLFVVSRPDGAGFLDPRADASAVLDALAPSGLGCGGNLSRRRSSRPRRCRALGRRSCAFIRHSPLCSGSS